MNMQLKVVTDIILGRRFDMFQIREETGPCFLLLSTGGTSTGAFVAMRVYGFVF
jgi:hypothetical protein